MRQAYADGHVNHKWAPACARLGTGPSSALEDLEWIGWVGVVVS